MTVAKKIAEHGVLSHDAILATLARGLGGKFTGQKVLVLIPDHTRAVPLPELFRMIVEVLDDVRELNVMVALGTHPGYSEAGLNHLVGITAEERATTYKHVGLLNHAWDDPAALASLGIGADEIKQLPARAPLFAADRDQHPHNKAAGARCHHHPGPTRRMKLSVWAA